MDAHEVKTSLMEELLVLVLIPGAATFAWILMIARSMDSAVTGWATVGAGLIVAEALDPKRFAKGLSAYNLMLRCAINMFAAMSSMLVSGVLVVANGPPRPEGAIPFLNVISAFVTMVAVGRLAIRTTELSTRLDMDAIRRWFNQ